MQTHLRRATPAHIPASEDELLDRHQAAQLLGITVRTLDRWASLRIGPPRVHLGPRLIRYRRSSLIGFAAANEVAQPRAAVGRAA